MRSISAASLVTEMQHCAPQDRPALCTEMWDVLDQAWIAYLAASGFSRKATQLYSTPTSTKVSMIKELLPELSDVLTRYKELAGRARYGQVQDHEVDAFFDLSVRLIQAIGAFELTYTSRVPPSGPRGSGSDCNRASVETPEGFRSIHLRHAMVTQQDVDLVILTALTGVPLGGFIVEQLRDCYGFECEASAPFLTFGPGRWSSVQAGDYPRTSFRRIMTVMLPDISQDPDHLRRIRSMCDGIRASLAAMEVLGIPARTIALPVLQAHLLQVGAEYQMLTRELLQFAANWLKQSAAATEITFCVYFGNQLEMWAEEFDRALGRNTVSAGEDLILKILRDEVIQLSLRVPDSALKSEVEDLRQQLKADTLRIAPVVTLGRRIVERMCEEHYSINNKKRPFELWKAIEGLASFNISPWLRTYLHTLRVLGNEGVHVRDDQQPWIPNQLDRDDLVTGLSAIRTVLAYYLSVKKK
jgi:Domain of unknown function (DUF4145)